MRVAANPLAERPSLVHHRERKIFNTMEEAKAHGVERARQ
jgi:hypothetical protein